MPRGRRQGGRIGSQLLQECKNLAQFQGGIVGIEPGVTVADHDEVTAPAKAQDGTFRIDQIDARGGGGWPPF